MNNLKFFFLFSYLGFICLSPINAQKRIQPKLSPAEWWTAPYKQVFEDAELTYALNPQEAYKIINALIQRATNDEQHRWQYQGYFMKGRFLESQLAYQEALDNYQVASRIIKTKDPQLYANVQIDIAIMHRYLYSYSDARAVYFNLIDFSGLHKDSANLLHAYGGLGVLFFTVNDYDNAIRYYDKALLKSREIHDYVNECVYLDNLSEAYGCRKEFTKAYAHIALACQIAENEKDIESLIPLYERYARLYAETEDFDRAFQKIDTALQLCENTDFIKERNNLTMAKAELYLKKRDNEAALKAFKTINEKLINVNSLTKVYFEMGKIYANKKDWGLAALYFEKTQELADKNKYLRYSEWSHRALYGIFRARNQASEALYHLEKANILRDSLFNYEKSGQMTELQFRYDLTQSEQKLNDVQLKANRNMMLIGLLVGVLIILGLVYNYNLQKKQNDILTLKNEAIREQKEQLESFNREILQKSKAIEEQKRRLEESNGMLQQFNYAVAHDLKEPLRNIANFATLIQRRYLKDMPPVAAEYFEFVMSGSIRMGKMLDGLLKYSMLSLDQVTDLEDVDMNAIVNEVRQNLRMVTEEKEAQILAPSLLPHVHINRIHLTQLIQNLVSNGIKFVEGAPIVEIGSQEDKENVILFVKDNGIGIHKDSGKKLFNLFHRLHQDSTKFAGTGVGLAVCKSIVEKYGGKIWFESEVEQGTTFFMQFPKTPALLN
jgi:signal transduction histidine kinase